MATLRKALVLALAVSLVLFLSVETALADGAPVSQQVSSAASTVSDKVGQSAHDTKESAKNTGASWSSWAKSKFEGLGWGSSAPAPAPGSA